MIIHEYLEPTFVHQPMVVTAQQHQVVEAGFAPLRPVLHVMRIHEPIVGATWEATVPIPGRQQAFHRRRHAATLATDADRPGRSVTHGDQRTVTGQTPNGLDRQI
jgi:hypothetical protein